MKSFGVAGTGANANATKKKLVIVPFKNKPKLPDNFEETTWAKLEACIHAINTNTSIDTSKEELYRAVEDVCMHKLAASTYTKLSKEIEKFVINKVDSLRNQTHLDHVSFLQQVDTVWRAHCDHASTIRNIFMYLDRSYALPTQGVKSVWDLGIYYFGSRLQHEDCADVQKKLIVGLLAMVESERQNQSIDKSIVQRLLRMLFNIGIYTDKFEYLFLSDSNRFFATEGQELIDSVDTPSFLLHVEKRLQQASEMVREYLDVSTKSPLISVIDNMLLLPHVGVIVERGLKGLMEQGRVKDIRRMFLLLERVDKLELLKEGVSNYVKKHGESLVSDTSREKNLIDDLLQFQDQCSMILKECFKNADSFRFSLKAAFEYLINPTVNHGKPAELLARFLDKKLRGEKGVSEHEVEAVFDRAMVLFRYLNGKDVFEAFYKKLLAKRLLLGKSANSDLERSMLSKLKTECGSNFTAKLEGMFLDMEFSRTVMDQYSTVIKAADTNSDLSSSSASSSSSSSSYNLTSMPQVECNFQVLATGFWPSASPVTTVLPKELECHKQRFLNFYTDRYQGRRLVWNPSLDRVVITARFPKGKKELELSLFQATVLIAFNKLAENASDSTRQYLQLKDLEEETKIEVGELKRTLQSLACGMIGTRVLTKEPKGKEVEETDKFYFNDDFTNKLYRIKINTIQLKETEEETERTHDEVFRDRQYQVDAVIVRTMKARKTLSHNMLMSELMTQLKFPARPGDLKKRIESLIEREYLARDENDNSMYNYLA